MSRNHNFSPVQISKSISEIVNAPSINFETSPDILRFALGILDLTTLEGADTKARVEALCKKASGFSATGLPNVAAVCVYPVFARQVKGLLHSTGIQTACVAGAFPSGQSPLHVKIAEVKYAVDEGADEIDMVISRGKMLEGDYAAVLDEIKAVKAACGEARLKVILETGELKSIDLIRKASELALEGGADFLKTSTGKIQPAATAEASVVMLDTILEYYQQTGIQVGFKPAGGIAEPEDAMLYYKLVKEVVGEQWLHNQWFRIGASRLADKIKAILNA